MSADLFDRRAYDEVAFADFPGEDVLGRFVAELYRDAERGELSFVYGTSANQVSWHGLDVHALSAAARRQTGNVWVPIGSRREKLADGKRGGAADVLHVYAFVVDLDIRCAWHGRDDLPPTLDDAREVLNAFPLAPTVITRTGGGLQGWYFLSEPAEAGDAREVLGRWGANWRELGRRRGWHVDSTSSLDHVFRAPGTLNMKAGSMVTVEHADYTRRYGLDDIDEACVEEEVPPKPKPAARPRNGTPLAGDRYNQAHTCDELLEDAGCVLSHVTRAGDAHYFAPHRAASREQTGVTVYADGHCAVWSETFASARGLDTATDPDARTYDAFGLYAHLAHGGNFEAAAKAYATIDPPPRSELLLRPSGTPSDVDPTTGEIVTTGLPDAFWTARPELDHIRQAARSAMVAPDALFGAVLARIAAFTPPSRCLPAIVGDTVTLAMLVALIGETGDGKTAASNAARRLIPNTPPGIFTGGLGSGEGLIEAFLDTVSETVDGKARTVKRQKRHGALFALDEGSVLAEIGSRRGSTILPILCSAWMGAEIGQANASGDTKRHLAFGSYTVGLVSLWQPHAAARLLDDADGGTPGRFLFLPTDDATAPDDAPDWPGPLDWAPPPLCTFGDGLELPDDIAERIRTHRRAVLRRETTLAPLDKHSHLLTEKVSGILAVLGGCRRQIAVDDWKLAEMVMRVSNRTRATVVEAARLAASRAEDAAFGRAARREVAIGDGLRDNAIRSMARSIARRIERVGPLTRSAAGHATASKHREHATLDEALEYATDRGWIEYDGTDEVYRLGESRPA